MDLHEPNGMPGPATLRAIRTLAAKRAAELPAAPTVALHGTDVRPAAERHGGWSNRLASGGRRVLARLRTAAGPTT